MVYANEISKMENCFSDLTSSEIFLKYPKFQRYIDTVYEDKEYWALP